MFRLHLVAVLLCLVVVSVRAAEDSVGVATFNIHYGNSSLRAVASAIQEADPTIIALQETNRQSEHFLRSTFAGRYPHMHFVAFRGEYAEEGLAFLSKLPLDDITFTAPANGLFGSFYATFSHDGLRVRIANVHLSPFLIRRGSGFIEAYQALQNSEATREREISEILSSIRVTDPTVICGDFNSLSWFVAPKQLVKNGFVDSFASVTKTPDIHPTWHWTLDQRELRARIDYIFHSRHFVTESSKIIRTKGSDHSLLVSVLKKKSDE